MTEPLLNSTTTAQMVVGDSDLASALTMRSEDAFPAVFATARMVALMEIASARLLHACLGAGELSVGVSVEVTHTAPTPKGATVMAEARYVGREGKLFLFELVASDQAGEIGRGRHKRAIVSVERLQAGALKRNP